MSIPRIFEKKNGRVAPPDERNLIFSNLQEGVTHYIKKFCVLVFELAWSQNLSHRCRHPFSRNSKIVFKMSQNVQVHQKPIIFFDFSIFFLSYRIKRRKMSCITTTRLPLSITNSVVYFSLLLLTKDSFSQSGVPSQEKSKPSF